MLEIKTRILKFVKEKGVPDSRTEIRSELQSLGTYSQVSELNILSEKIFDKAIEIVTTPKSNKKGDKEIQTIITHVYSMSEIRRMRSRDTIIFVCGRDVMTAL